MKSKDAIIFKFNHDQKQREEYGAQNGKRIDLNIVQMKLADGSEVLVD